MAYFSLLFLSLFFSSCFLSPPIAYWSITKNAATNSCQMTCKITGIEQLTLPQEYHMIFISSSEFGKLVPGETGYSWYGTFVAANTAFAGVDFKQWVLTSDVTGRDHPNQPGNLGTIAVVSGEEDTTLVMEYTAAQSNGDFRFMRIANRHITSIMLNRGADVVNEHVLERHSINDYTVQGFMSDFSVCNESPVPEKLNSLESGAVSTAWSLMTCGIGAYFM